MMRSMYSGVAGLKTHQTKMDVIGNNIANVNTAAFKSSSTTFSELMYQNLSGASGPTDNGRGGVNAKQIGLGVQFASTSVNITSPGASQTTGDGNDLMITGDSFFIVNNGTTNLFTKAGAFYIDGAGNLAMKSTGYNVMGWQVDPNTGEIRKDTVSPLRILTEANMTSPPEATTLGRASGILDRNSTQVNSDDGYIMNLNFNDALGYSYTASFAVKATNVKGEYTVELKDIIDSTGTSLVDVYNVGALSDLVQFGTQTVQTENVAVELKQGVHFQEDPTAPNGYGYYTKDVYFPEMVTDYDLKRIPGFEAGTDVTDNGDTVTAHFSATYAPDKLEELYGIIYDADQKDYFWTDETGTRQQLGTNSDLWMQAMGIDATESGVTNFQVDNSAGDGTLTFTFDQNFTLDPSAERADPGDPNNNMYTMDIEMMEAYDGLDPNKEYTPLVVAPNGRAQFQSSTVVNGNVLRFDVDTGLFVSIGGGDAVTLDFMDNVTDLQGNTQSLNSFLDIDVDFTQTKWFDNGGTSTMGMDPGGLDGVTGKGKKLGALNGLQISQDGTIWASYDNGNTELLGQIAVASFANPSGLEKIGESCYQTTLNSGDFDGIGQDVTSDGGKMTSGVLEMSNVDLATEFTEMIVTQRGFQANSRIITTSDTLLEELINLKR